MKNISQAINQYLRRPSLVLALIIGAGLQNICENNAQATSYAFDPTEILPANIPDGGPELALHYNVFGLTGDIQRVTLEINMVSPGHTWIGDLIFTLFAPNGVGFSIFNRPGRILANGGFGYSSDFLGPYIFAEGGNSIWAAAASSSIVPSGTYYPVGQDNVYGSMQGTMDTFGGTTPAAVQGTWELDIVDNATADVGTISTAKLHFETVPEPSTWAMLTCAGAGLFFFRRHRVA